MPPSLPKISITNGNIFSSRPLGDGKGLENSVISQIHRIWSTSQNFKHLSFRLNSSAVLLIKEHKIESYHAKGFRPH